MIEHGVVVAEGRVYGVTMKATHFAFRASGRERALAAPLRAAVCGVRPHTMLASYVNEATGAALQDAGRYW